VLFLSTLDGSLIAVRKNTGKVVWSLKEGLLQYCQYNRYVPVFFLDNMYCNTVSFFVKYLYAGSLQIPL